MSGAIVIERGWYRWRSRDVVGNTTSGPPATLWSRARVAGFTAAATDWPTVHQRWPWPSLSLTHVETAVLCSVMWVIDGEWHNPVYSVHVQRASDMSGTKHTFRDIVPRRRRRWCQISSFVRRQVAVAGKITSCKIADKRRRTDQWVRVGGRGHRMGVGRWGDGRLSPGLTSYLERSKTRRRAGSNWLLATGAICHVTPLTGLQTDRPPPTTNPYPTKPTSLPHFRTCCKQILLLLLYFVRF